MDLTELPYTGFWGKMERKNWGDTKILTWKWSASPRMKKFKYFREEHAKNISYTVRKLKYDNGFQIFDLKYILFNNSDLGYTFSELFI